MVNLQETIAEKELGTKIPAPVLDGGRATAPARHRESTVYTRERLPPYYPKHDRQLSALAAPVILKNRKSTYLKNMRLGFAQAA